MPTGQKSPLHPSALTINGLTPGRKIVLFNLERATATPFIVMGHPFVGTIVWHPGRATYVAVRALTSATVRRRGYLVVNLREAATGTVKYLSVRDMGIVAYSSGRFNPVNVTVDHRKRHLLPTTPNPRAMRNDTWLDDLIERVLPPEDNKFLE